MKPVRKAISLVFKNENGRHLIIRRSKFKDTYPNSWSIPSTYLQNEETPKKAATRLVKNKLSLEEVDINPVPIGTSKVDRGDYILQMSDFKVTNYKGSFKLNLSEYTDMKWVTINELKNLMEKEHQGVMGECIKTLLKASGTL